MIVGGIYWRYTRIEAFSSAASATTVSVFKSEPYIRPIALSSFFELNDAGDYKVSICRHMSDTASDDLHAPEFRFRLV